MLVDSHCHLDFPDFADDLDAIVARAETAGIGRMVTISTRVKRLGGLLAIAERFPNVYCSVGTHPHNADEEDGIPASELIELAKHPKVVALGEAGLDNFYEHGSHAARRSAAFAPISRPLAPPACRWSFIPAKPISTAPVSSKTRWPRGLSRRAALLHRRPDLAMKAIELGPVDFVHRYPDLQEVAAAACDLAAELPADRIMVETDSPYLAPGKFRGKRNEPSYVVEIAKVLAETRGVSLEEISRQTTENFFRLFSKVPASAEGHAHDADADHPRLRILGRRTAPGTGLGRLRSPTIPKTAAAAVHCWSSAPRSRAPRGRDRHFAGPA